MKQTNKRGIRKLSLSSDTVRRLATSDLARAQGGLYITYSYCVDVDENTVPDYTAGAGQCSGKGTKNTMAGCP
jgi:hypothetical protein